MDCSHTESCNCSSTLVHRHICYLHKKRFLVCSYIARRRWILVFTLINDSQKFHSRWKLRKVLYNYEKYYIRQTKRNIYTVCCQKHNTLMSIQCWVTFLKKIVSKMKFQIGKFTINKIITENYFFVRIKVNGRY